MHGGALVVVAQVDVDAAVDDELLELRQVALGGGVAQLDARVAVLELGLRLGLGEAVLRRTGRRLATAP